MKMAREDYNLHLVNPTDLQLVEINHSVPSSVQTSTLVVLPFNLPVASINTFSTTGGAVRPLPPPKYLSPNCDRGILTTFECAATEGSWLNAVSVTGMPVTSRSLPGVIAKCQLCEWLEGSTGIVGKEI